ncbi:unnamed protein product, partial [Ixodes hexagonus]
AGQQQAPSVTANSPASAASAPTHPTAVTTATCTPTTTTTTNASSPCVPSARSSPPLARLVPSPTPLQNGPSWPPQLPPAASSPAFTSLPVSPPPTTTCPLSPPVAVTSCAAASQRPRVGPSPVAPPQCRPSGEPPSPPSAPSAPSLVSELLSQPPFLSSEALNGSHSSNGSSSVPGGLAPRDLQLFNSGRTAVGHLPPSSSSSAGAVAGAPALRNGSLFANSSSPSPLLASHLVHSGGGASSRESSGSVSKPVTPAAAAPAPAPLFPFSLSRASPQGFLSSGGSAPQTAAVTRPGVSTPPTQAATPTPSLGSSHSNSSLSSLSQLSQSLQGKESGRSRNTTPSALAPLGTSVAPPGNPAVSCGGGTPVGGYSTASSNSLTSLVFSKPWVSPSPGSYPGASNGPPLGVGTSPVPHHRPTPPPALPSGAAAGAAPLGNSHHFPPHPGMFAAPIPPPAAPTLASSGLGLPSGPTSYVGESPLLPSDTTPILRTSLADQDLLRRELDTRFLASQDRSIAIPPPPYMRTELHQHHSPHQQHLHPHSPFLPPALAGSLVPQPGPHLYDKFHTKLDSPFYSRSALGLSGYTGLSPLLNPSMTSGTPFVAPGHLAAFQPKGDMLRAPNHHLYSGMPRPHDLSSFPSALLGAAAAAAAGGMSRMPVSTSSSSMSRSSSSRGLPPGMSPFARPSFPSFGPPANSAYGTLGGLGLSAANPASLFAAGRDLGPAGCLAVGQDPWGRLHRTPPFPGSGTGSLGPLGPQGPQGPGGMDRSPVASGAWGGLKAEADRERLEHESEKQRRLEAEKERKEREALEKAKEMDRDREARLHMHHSQQDGILRNGDYLDARVNSHPMGREREPHGRPSEWGLRDMTSRSPARAPKAEAFDSLNTPKTEVRVKEERRDEEPERKKAAPPPPAPDPGPDYRAQHFLGLGGPERAFWGGALGAPPGDPYRSLLDFHARGELDREQLLQRYRLLGPMVPLHDRFREAAPSDLERYALERELHSKLAPPPLRTTDPSPQAGGFPAGALLTSLASGRGKNGSSPAVGAGSRDGGGAVPPPLVPCGGAGGPGVNSHGMSSLNHKMSSLVEHGAHELALYAKDRAALANHKADPTQLSYTLGVVQKRVFGAVKQFCLEEDSALVHKLKQLHRAGFSPDQLGVRDAFCCPVPRAVVELASLDSKLTPLEKLWCLKTTLKVMSEEIYESTPYKTARLKNPHEQLHLTSDDLIPILVCLIVKCKLPHLESNLYYIQNFSWHLPDKDMLGYTLVTFQAAKEFIKSQDTSCLKPSSTNMKGEITPLELMQMTAELELCEKPKEPGASEKPPSGAGPSTGRSRSIDRQLEQVTKLIESATKELQTREVQGKHNLQELFKNGEESSSKSGVGEFFVGLHDSLGVTYGKL